MQKIDKETEKKFLKAESCRVSRDFEKAISIFKAILVIVEYYCEFI